ncbi:hypothetical protein [Spiroplasma turonicum]|uniref:HTH merR-type domain-containing protein n=1 Tax=Spiroplasma turonicum TaxID=216946 RepID=A0A0K1P6C7_9MOLU|nr:hypothetical protein [Spiroplasma turonicum]AKU79866.1 hypothetical protein STURON_00620 [Spiroplasma turonicum]ALX70882.1 hypothetical protein STURO_v1c06190 [Spiroplasma turonicum]
MKYNSKIIRHKTNSSLKQIKNYVDKKLLNSSIIDNKLEMNDYELIKLYKIKFLQYIGFSLDDIKIIFDNMKDIDIYKMFNYFLITENNLLSCFENNFKTFLNSNSLIINIDTFGYFKSESLGRGVMFELYNFRKMWYQDKFKKEELKDLRSSIFKEFHIYNKNNNITELNSLFTKLNYFLESNIINYNKLHFLCLFKWWTTDPRYVKQIKNRCKLNYGPEIFKQALIWCSKY